MRKGQIKIGIRSAVVEPFTHLITHPSFDIELEASGEMREACIDCGPASPADKLEVVIGAELAFGNVAQQFVQAISGNVQRHLDLLSMNVYVQYASNCTYQ